MNVEDGEMEFPLRDWFAGQALTGIRTRSPWIKDYRERNKVRPVTSEEVAAQAYADADAMLVERAKTK